MVRVTIEYYYWTDTDPYERYIGRAIDTPLNPDFWRTQPDKVIGTAVGSYFYSETVDLSPGEHYVECRTSGYALPPYEQYKWFVRVKVDGKEIGSDSCGRDKVAKFTFRVEQKPSPPPEQPSPPSEGLTGTLLGAILIGAVIAVGVILALKAGKKK